MLGENLAIVINTVYNNSAGLGGGTRHLHQYKLNYGDEIGSTGPKKICFTQNDNLCKGSKTQMQT